MTDTPTDAERYARRAVAVCLLCVVVAMLSAIVCIFAPRCKCVMTPPCACPRVEEPWPQLRPTLAKDCECKPDECSPVRKKLDIELSPQFMKLRDELVDLREYKRQAEANKKECKECGNKDAVIQAIRKDWRELFDRSMAQAGKSAGGWNRVALFPAIDGVAEVSVTLMPRPGAWELLSNSRKELWLRPLANPVVKQSLTTPRIFNGDCCCPSCDGCNCAKNGCKCGGQ